MKEFHPHIVVSSISDVHSDRMQKILDMVQAKFKEMGIKAFFMPENFSKEDAAQWARDVTDERDFFLNFEFSDDSSLAYKNEEDAELAEILRNEISRRSDEEYSITPFSSLTEESGKKTETHTFLENLPLHTYSIYFSPHKSDSEIKMNIMACVTDICFIPHALVSEDDRWAFRDVPSYHFAAAALKKAKEKGIIPGYKGDIIYPNGGVTRGEMIYMFDKLGKL